MAALTENERVGVWKRLIGTLSRRDLSRTTTLSKAEWRALVDDIDTWAEANQTAFNQAIRAAVRNKATATEKALALAYVALQRAGEPLGEG